MLARGGLQAVSVCREALGTVGDSEGQASTQSCSGHLAALTRAATFPELLH